MITTGGLKIDRTARRVHVNGVEKSLTTKEFDLLYFLAKNPNRVFSKEELLQEVWEMDPVGPDILKRFGRWVIGLLFKKPICGRISFHLVLLQHP